MIISDLQKIIYNLYLKSYRINNNKPFSERKNFSKLKEDEYTYLKKLESFFTKNEHLLNIDYFNAPYEIYKNTNKKFYSLKFYSSYKGLKTCVAYFNLIQKQKPDEQLDFIKHSLRFIIKFCIEKNISLNNYATYKSVAQYDYFKHLKEHKISWYVIFSIPNMYNNLYNMYKDEYELYFGNVDLDELQKEYNKNLNTKKYLEKVVKKLKEHVEINIKM